MITGISDWEKGGEQNIAWECFVFFETEIKAHIFLMLLPVVLFTPTTIIIIVPSKWLQAKFVVLALHGTC